jgi:hypothetical protein
MTASQMRIAETIDAFYGDAGAKDGVSRSYKRWRIWTPRPSRPSTGRIGTDCHGCPSYGDVQCADQAQDNGARAYFEILCLLPRR